MQIDLDVVTSTS